MKNEQFIFRRNFFVIELVKWLLMMTISRVEFRDIVDHVIVRRMPQIKCQITHALDIETRSDQHFVTMCGNTNQQQTRKKKSWQQESKLKKKKSHRILMARRRIISSIFLHTLESFSTFFFRFEMKSFFRKFP